MVDAGIIAEDERIELVEGELVVMAAKGYAHELVKLALNEVLVRAAGKDVRIGVESTIQFAPGVLLEPDLSLLARNKVKESAAGYIELEQGGCLLIVEVAQTSLGYDRGRKAALYASFGVQEFWVVDANERTAWIHSGSTPEGWSSIVERGPDDALTTPALPSFSVKLGALD